MEENQDPIIDITPPPAVPSAPPAQSLMIPLAIVIAGVIIGGSIYFVEKGKTPPPSASPSAPVLLKNVPPVTAADHMQGDISAPVKIVEYTDIECPFCKDFTPTMEKIVLSYPGKVAWIIRNFPIQQLHPNAPKLALAAECIADLGGNDKYWKFLDSVLQQAPVITQPGVGSQRIITDAKFFDMTKLTSTAQSVGIDGKGFDSCVASGKFQDKISAQFNDAVAAGGEGTPFSVLITKDGSQILISGDQPYDKVKAAVDAALKG